MKERPIIFNAPMVRSLLAGTKTQTRRLVKPQPETSLDGEPYWHIGGYRAWEYRETADMLCKAGDHLRCPFGAPGDRLWVKEAWAAPHGFDHLPPRLVAQTARIHFAASEDLGGLLKRSSMFLPRWASRITLEVIGVRVERLHDISEADCQAEGIESYALNGGTSSTGALKLPAGYYRYLWESINGPGSWDANPWVWAITFARLEQP